MAGSAGEGGEACGLSVGLAASKFRRKGGDGGTVVA